MSKRFDRFSPLLREYGLGGITRKILIINTCQIPSLKNMGENPNRTGLL